MVKVMGQANAVGPDNAVGPTSSEGSSFGRSIVSEFL